MFPSLFWKSRQSYEKKNGKWVKGQRLVAHGSVVDEARRYPSVDEAIVALGNRPFTFKRENCAAPVFGQRAFDIVDEKNINRREFIPNINFK